MANKINKSSKQCKTIELKMQQNAKKEINIINQIDVCNELSGINCKKNAQEYRQLVSNDVDLLFDYQANDCQSQFDAEKVYDEEFNKK